MTCFRLHGCIFAVSCCWFVILTVAQTTHPSEVKGLLAIKKRLIDPMRYLDNWNKGDPCTSNWTGIFCSDAVSVDGYYKVEKLHLLNMNLSGSLAPELGQLSHLQILDFMWNELTGSIPKELGNIKPLMLLLLNGNKLSGSLPEELGYYSNLNRLQVDQNDISGPVPKSFANLKNIRHLHLNNNSISGQIPSELSNLRTLYHLLLDNNNLSGYLPSEFYKLSDLRILQLDNNNFEGTQIPDSYGDMSRLVKLSLRNCSLQGPVPDLSRIANFSYLDLSFNKLTGSIPSNKLSTKMTTIDMSNNHLNGSVPESFSGLPTLQTLSLENNKLTGSVPANIWRNVSFGSTARLMLDFRNNSFESIMGDLDPSQNVTLRLQGNPICNTANIGKFCGSQGSDDESPDSSTDSTDTCPIQACPVHNFFDYVPGSPVPCFCASPLRIGYRLKSPSFSYFPPYENPFKVYLTGSLNLEVYQLSIESFQWEEGPRLRMNLKLFPAFSDDHSNTLNASEIQRIKAKFTSWEFFSNDTYGPYELLNFTLLGPYVNSDFETRSGGTSKAILTAILVGAIVCAASISAFVAALLIARKRARYHNLSKRRTSSQIFMKIDGVKSFTYREMALGTDNFNSSTQVGKGGYGKVYKGRLSDNTLVAIKRADDGSFQGQKEFLTEIELLSRLHHRNLVSLIGYCDEEGEQMLVYEFMPNGTLRDWISGRVGKNLNFDMRVRIALGSAKGILYLHTEAQPPIFHRDIKATNILLDSRFTAKVADFGLSRLAPLLEDEGCVPDHVSTTVKGTPGYLDPEYFLTRKLTDKSDVYSLGVVFLELLTGMQPITHGKNIVREVNLAHQSGMIFEIIDSKLGSYSSECIERFVSLALTCCHEKTESRPPMLDVVRELENILRLMPETDTNSSGSRPSGGYSVTSASSSLSYFSKDIMSMSSDVSGSDLVSGAVPRITPR